jgi:hypothetical protein
MTKSPNTRERLDHRMGSLEHFVEDLDTTCAATFTEAWKRRDTDVQNVEHLAEVMAGLFRALELQQEAKRLDWQMFNYARKLAYWRRPWWQRAWLRITGKAPAMARTGRSTQA